MPADGVATTLLLVGAVSFANRRRIPRAESGRTTLLLLEVDTSVLLLLLVLLLMMSPKARCRILRMAERVFKPLRTCNARIACGVDGAYLVVVVVVGLPFPVAVAGVEELASSVRGRLRVDIVWYFGVWGRGRFDGGSWYS